MLHIIGIIAFILFIFFLLFSASQISKSKKSTVKSGKKAAVAFLIFVIAAYLSVNYSGSTLDIADMVQQSPNEYADNFMEVHFIDVGQGDAALIRIPGNKFILIDGGQPKYGPYIVNYMKQLGVKELSYLIITHPHIDHIGGLEDVVLSFPINEIYMPRVIHSTKTFESLLESIRSKGMKIKQAKSGVKLILGEDVEGIFLAPEHGKTYENLNDYSAVLKITYDGKSILFTGDAEEISEKEMLNNQRDVKADVLKIGHHGSSTSTTEDFLEAVSPEYAVISSGKGNDYGHPHKETLERLDNKGVTILRTDINGTIILKIAGGKIQFQ